FRAYVDWIFRSFKTLELRILLVGDDDSGKTTLLHQWYHQKFVDLPPNYMGGFEVQTVEYPQKCRWTIWDITLGSDPIRKLLYHYFQNTAAVLYVHDCDRHLDDAISSVHYYIGVMLERECSLLYIVPNKQDKLPSEKSQGLAHDLREAYKKELARYEGQICWKVLDFKISAKTGEGVWEILDEIYGEL
ncbi:hypothetical protein N7519_000219, partial [Penicillium mononematosum]|uniref:uncharacterized protein n=1 Tax=Penicillium mononematosum TaxID=268346 RepID=UPI002549B600